MQTRTGHSAGQPERAGASAKRTVIIRLAGEIDREAAESCEWTLYSAGEGALQVVVDLSEARSFDHRCLPIFVARARKLQALGGGMAVAASAGPVASIIKASTSELPVLPSVDLAVEAVQGGLAMAGVGTGIRGGVLGHPLKRRF